jgi:DNA topoisomerase-3
VAKKAASKTAARSSAKKAVRAPAAGKTPSAALAAVIGAEPVSRPQALKKVWEYIRAQNLQDPQDRRTIVADARLRQVLGRDRVGMLEITGLLGEHLQ